MGRTFGVHYFVYFLMVAPKENPSVSARVSMVGATGIAPVTLGPCEGRGLSLCFYILTPFYGGGYALPAGFLVG